jgi:hypothetical protein
VYMYESCTVQYFRTVDVYDCSEPIPTALAVVEGSVWEVVA